MTESFLCSSVASSPRLETALVRALTPWISDGGRVGVAYSAGRDSTALLHAAWLIASQRGATVHALHVHHGLSPSATAWVAHGRRQCEAWSSSEAQVTFHLAELELRPAAGESIEAVARAARYRALARMAHEAGCSTVLLAHHRDDQVETFLLQALRGAGPAGLSAMPVRVVRDGIEWVRPWLDRPRSSLQAHLHAHGLACVDDESNAERRHARNRLRLDVLPALRASFAGADAALSAAARRAGDARECLDALAQLDLRTVAIDGGLDIDRLGALGWARTRNVLRLWLPNCTGRPAAASLLERLPEELARSEAGSWPHADGWLRVHGGRLLWCSGAAEDSGARDGVPGLPDELQMDLKIGPNAVPRWAGVLWLEPATAGGVPMAEVTRVCIGPRRGGEQFQSQGSIPRSLKKAFQNAGIPSWARRGPLVRSGGQLVFVPGLGLDARSMAREGDPRVTLRWTRLDAAPAAAAANEMGGAAS